MTLPTEDVTALVARLREMADTEVFLHGIENSTVPSALREAATTLSTLAGERDSAERALLTVQNAAKTIAAAHGTEIEHLRQNASFDHSLRAEVESLRQHNSEMTDALTAAEARIAGLEAERDGLKLALISEKEFSAAQNGGNRHASSEWTKTLLKLREAQKERDAVIAAGEALSLALSRYGFPMSDEAWRNTGDDAPVNSQASVEARALHRAALAFFRDVSGARESLSRQEGGR